MRKQCYKQARKGAALIISLWALLLLAAAVFAWLKFLDQEIAIGADANRGLEARAAAYSGVTVALHPLVGPQTPLLDANLGDERGYNVRITGEGGKLNLNWLLAGQQPVKLEMLNQYLSRIGLNFEERQKLIDCLLDWVDTDNLTHLNGAEESADYRPPNRPLLSLDEVEMVKNSRPLVSKAGWQEGFTLESNGPLDLRYASENAIASLPGIGDKRAQNFLQFRRGPDKKDFTRDDPDFKGGLPTMLNYLGIGPAQQKTINGLVAANDPAFFIVSRGFSGKVHRQIEVVAIKAGGTPNIRSWKEF